MSETLSGYSFAPADLRVADRRPGISAFMRIRNGADFLEAAIRSHIDHFDEIVAVYNHCTDATEAILLRLRGELGPRLRVVHYLDRVHPPGSEAHAATDPASPNSLVNYYNAALAQTRYRVATKLDDDHVALEAALAEVTASIRAGGAEGRMLCFSGLNLYHTAGGRLAIPAHDPVSGGGDIGFFPVSEATVFRHDRRFERFDRGGLARRFAGFLYWHLKYLKPGHGFANYELDRNPASRYARRAEVFAAGTVRPLGLAEIAAARRPGLAARLKGLASEKTRLVAERDAAIARAFPGGDLEAAVRATTAPSYWPAMGLA
jgi:hypothetical protein